MFLSDSLGILSDCLGISAGGLESFLHVGNFWPSLSISLNENSCMNNLRNVLFVIPFLSLFYFL